jgi:predicted PurR-regulated permease PerM
MAGSFAGIPGMILAIPSYTVLRIIAKQFFTESKLVQKITEHI